MAHSTVSTARLVGMWLLIGLGAAWGFSEAVAGRGGLGRAGLADRGRGAEDESLLNEYFRLLLADRDFDAFRDRVVARYGEESLGRLLADSPSVNTRRAAAAALGSVGGYRRSNSTLARALGDKDPVVRQLAENSLWSIWFRASTLEHNQALQQVLKLAEDGETRRAEEMASRLIAVAPDFAEAYNQRAILYFKQGRFADSARDCQRVIGLNPYHFGALGGLFQCQIYLHQPGEALETLRRAARLQPHNTSFRDAIRSLEAQLTANGPK
jgi:tetratricopeptide (TPR) repeat protein